MHHNRSLLPIVEVLLGVMVKTSTCSNKLLFVILNFYSRLFSWFWSNFRISKFLAKFHNFAVFRIYLNGQNLNNPIMIWVRFCIFVFFILHCVRFWNVSTNFLPHEAIQNHIGCICLDFSPLCILILVFKAFVKEDQNWHWLHLFGFSPLCAVKCVLKWPAWEDALSHWLHLFFLSPLCIFKCVVKALAQSDVESHWLHLFDFSPLFILKGFRKSHAQEYA